MLVKSPLFFLKSYLLCRSNSNTSVGFQKQKSVSSIPHLLASRPYVYISKSFLFKAVFLMVKAKAPIVCCLKPMFIGQNPMFVVKSDTQSCLTAYCASQPSLRLKPHSNHHASRIVHPRMARLARLEPKGRAGTGVKFSTSRPFQTHQMRFDCT